MPHKHKRREKDDSHFDLPPSVIAKSLPARDPQAKSKTGKKQQKKQPQQRDIDTKKKPAPATTRRKNDLEDDTPKAFRQLMQYQTTGRRAPSGLETGKKDGENKKRKRDGAEAKGDSQKKTARTEPQPKTEPTKPETKQVMPKILPGEKLSDFAARVDRELPLSAITKSVQQGGAKARDHKMTKHERHLRRLQQGWREEEAKIREREEAEREERADEMADQLELLKKWEAEARDGKAKKKGAVPKKKKKKAARRDGDGDVDGDGAAADSGDDDPDPWAKLKKRDKETKANPFDVAQAPPQLTKPREIFKVRGGAKVDVANIPNAVGSLRRREELAGERRNIVEEYRRLMAERRK